ncbi:MAG TPA: hypothetical protein VHB21_20620 [Minicystis sp.]|nr:hypothetical protein [Minicystis sp.]
MTRRRLRTPILFTMTLALAAAGGVVAASCGGDSGNGGSGGNGGGQTTSDGTGGTTTQGTGGTTTTQGTGGTTTTTQTTHDVCSDPEGDTINGCKADGSDATDMRGMGPQTIAFGGVNGLAYVPKCLLVNADQTVTFDGDFLSHPLTSGEVRGMTLCSDGGPLNFGGTGPKTFTLTAGTYPYYCGVHGAFGMNGLVIVQ